MHKRGLELIFCQTKCPTTAVIASITMEWKNADFPDKGQISSVMFTWIYVGLQIEKKILLSER